MELTDPWMELNQRYERDSEAQFLLFVEQFAEAISLTASGVTSKQRMALIAADNLAELLLHRHKGRILRLGSESNELDLPRLDRSDLREFERDFGTRVKLALKGGGEGMAGHMLDPLLNDGDEAIFRVAHAYRNRVYHADHHNSAVLPLLTTAYLEAVGRSFVRFQPTNIGHSPTATTAKLEAYGYKPEGDDFGGASFWPAKAAEAIVGHLSLDLEVSLAEARDTLQADLRSRADWADAMVDDLLGQGMPEERLEWSLRWGEFWDIAGVDPVVVGLDRELAHAWVSIVRDGDDDHSGFQRRNDLLGERNARIAELAKDFKSEFDLCDIERLRRLAGRLSSARNLGHLFDRYRRLDERMELVERHLDDTAIGWDRMIQMAVDEARGK